MCVICSCVKISINENEEKNGMFYDEYAIRGLLCQQLSDVITEMVKIVSFLQYFRIIFVESVRGSITY